MGISNNWIEFRLSELDAWVLWTEKQKAVSWTKSAATAVCAVNSFQSYFLPG